MNANTQQRTDTPCGVLNQSMLVLQLVVQLVNSVLHVAVRRTSRAAISRRLIHDTLVCRIHAIIHL